MKMCRNTFFLKTKASLLIFIWFASVSIFAQNKKKVLVVPFSRFEFNSEFTLDEMAQANNVNSDEIFDVFQQNILQSLKNYQDENFEFVLENQKIYERILSKISYNYQKFNHQKYYAVNLKTFSQKEFKEILDFYNADFIVFINWYQIKKGTYVSLGRKKKRTAYASHYFDFDIYNLFQQKIYGKGRFKLDFDAPTSENLQYNLLRMKEVVKGYQYFAKYIIEQINQPINTTN